MPTVPARTIEELPDATDLLDIALGQLSQLQRYRDARGPLTFLRIRDEIESGKPTRVVLKLMSDLITSRAAFGAVACLLEEQSADLTTLARDLRTVAGWEPPAVGELLS